jgi:hypothetical protein
VLSYLKKRTHSRALLSLSSCVACCHTIFLGASCQPLCNVWQRGSVGGCVHESKGDCNGDDHQLAGTRGKSIHTPMQWTAFIYVKLLSYHLALHVLPCSQIAMLSLHTRTIYARIHLLIRNMFICMYTHTPNNAHAKSHHTHTTHTRTAHAHTTHARNTPQVLRMKPHVDYTCMSFGAWEHSGLSIPNYDRPHAFGPDG